MPFFLVHAEPDSITPKDGVQSELSRLTESLDLLSAIKSGKRPTDATALQSALNDVLRLSEEEVRNVSLRLMAQHDGLTEDELTTQDALIADLADLKLHMKAVRMDTTQEAGPTAVASIAQKFKEWRDGPYAETIGRAATFVGVFENEDAIKAASARLTAILKDEKKIRSILPTSKTSAFMRLIKKAQGELRRATDLNTQAKTLLNPATTKSDNSETTDDLLHDSSALVNATYDDFIAMSRLIKK